MIERRKAVRFDMVMKALCGIAQEQPKSTYEVRNISKEGACLVVDGPLNNGSELNLSVDVPGDNVPIFASCQVAWQKELVPKPGARLYETGVKFTKINSSDVVRFLELVYSQWLKLYAISPRDKE